MRCKFDLRGEIEDIIYQFSIKDVSIKSILHEVLYAEKSLDTLIHHHDNDWIESLYCIAIGIFVQYALISSYGSTLPINVCISRDP